MAFKSSRRLIPSVRDRMDSVLEARQYYQKVLSYDPIAYWPLWEAAGLTARCLVDSPAQDGTYTGVTLGQPGIGDGNTAPFFDGANDFVDIYSAALNTAFDGDQGSLMIWMLAGAGFWTDGLIHYFVRLARDGDNSIFLTKPVDNNLRWYRRAGAVTDLVTTGGHSDANWIHLLMTWDTVADQLIGYKNALQEDGIQSTLAAWVGNLSAVLCVIGAINQTPTQPHLGRLAHCALFDRALTQPQIADLAVV